MQNSIEFSGSFSDDSQIKSKRSFINSKFGLENSVEFLEHDEFQKVYEKMKGLDLNAVTSLLNKRIQRRKVSRIVSLMRKNHLYTKIVDALNDIRNPHMDNGTDLQSDKEGEQISEKYFQAICQILIWCCDVRSDLSNRVLIATLYYLQKTMINKVYTGFLDSNFDAMRELIKKDFPKSKKINAKDIEEISELLKSSKRPTIHDQYQEVLNHLQLRLFPKIIDSGYGTSI